MIMTWELGKLSEADLGKWENEESGEFQISWLHTGGNYKEGNERGRQSAAILTSVRHLVKVGTWLRRVKRCSCN